MKENIMQSSSGPTNPATGVLLPNTKTAKAIFIMPELAGYTVYEPGRRINLETWILAITVVRDASIQ